MSKQYNMLSNVWMTFSEDEITRRHRALKDIMKKKNIPAAIVFSHDGVMRNWLLGEWTLGFAGAGDILIADGTSYSVMAEFLQFRLLEENESFDECVSPSNHAAIQCASCFSFLPISEAMERAGTRRLGLYRPNEMNVALCEYLKKHLGEVEYVDLTEAFDNARMIRSQEEIDGVRKSVYTLEKVFSAALSILQPGKTEYETINLLRNAAPNCVRGDMNTYMSNNLSLVSHPDGVPFVNKELLYPGKTLCRGDRVDIRFHCATDNWLYGMLARSFVLSEEISEDTLQKWEVAVKAHQLAASLIKPGATLKAAAKATNDFMLKNGCREDRTTFLYSVCNGTHEQPCLYDPSEKLPLCENMLICVAPTATFGDLAPMCCADVYVVTASGCRRLGELPFDMVAVKGL